MKSMKFPPKLCQFHGKLWKLISARRWRCFLSKHIFRFSPFFLHLTVSKVLMKYSFHVIYCEGSRWNSILISSGDEIIFRLKVFFLLRLIFAGWKTYCRTSSKSRPGSSCRTSSKRHKSLMVSTWVKHIAELWIIHEKTIDYLDKLFRQHGMHRDSPYELRSVCFIALKMALDSKRSNLITMGLNGMHVSFLLALDDVGRKPKILKLPFKNYFQKLIRDERFFIGLEPEDDSFWLPAQLLRSTNGISCTGNSSEETVVNVLRLFLSMACSPNITLNGRLLIEVLSRCGEFWEYGTRSVKAASLAAASQCLRTFCNFLKDEAEELKRTAPSGSNLLATTTIYNEVIPVMQWICSKVNILVLTWMNGRVMKVYLSSWLSLTTMERQRSSAAHCF